MKITQCEKITDASLVELLNQKDRQAYTEIYQRYWAILYRYSRRLLQNEEQARDVVQDIFIMLWNRADLINADQSLSSFLYASVRNRILKLFERDKVHEAYLTSLQSFMENDTVESDHLVRERELARRIEAEVALLPPKMREVFELSRKAHLSYREIAEILDISENTVKKQINNSLKILRLRLGSLFSVTTIFF